MKTLFTYTFLLTALVSGCTSEISEDSDMIHSTDKGGVSTFGRLHSGNSFEKVTLQADFAFAGMYTAQFNVSAPNRDLVAGIRTEALITWAVDGNFITRRISIFDGATITGVGKAVTVAITDVSVDVGHGPPSGVEYIVSVQVSSGTRPTTNQPPILVIAPGFYDIAGGGSQVGFAIPKDAGIISMSATVSALTIGPIPEGNARVGQFINGNPVKLYDPRVFEWVPIAPGVDSVALTNFSSVHQFWTITFGIDG